MVLAFVPALADAQETAYTAPGVFPTSLYDKYYNNPTATSDQPQPVISDPVTVTICLPYSFSDVLIFWLFPA